MREYKFRAKATQNYETSTDGVQKGDWVYGYYYYCTRRETGIIVTQLETESGGIGSGLVQVEIEVDCNTRGQYLGLPDKNGKEIYEEDVVRLPIKDRCLSGCCKYDESSDTYTTTVKYHNASFYINPHGRNSDVEIIDNIHENPELSREE